MLFISVNASKVFFFFYIKPVLIFSSRATVVAVAAFLDAFQKVADLATNSRGRNMLTDAGLSVQTVVFSHLFKYLV